MNKEGSAVKPDASVSDDTTPKKGGGSGGGNASNLDFSFSSSRAPKDAAEATDETPKGKKKPVQKVEPVQTTKPKGKADNTPEKPKDPVTNVATAQVATMATDVQEVATTVAAVPAVAPATTPVQAPKPTTPATPSPAPKPSTTQQPVVKPFVKPAKLKKRHWGLLLSFVLFVILPFSAILAYLIFVAEPQYESITGFTVRSQEERGANELLGGLSQLAGGGGASDNDILYEFIRSQEMVQVIDKRIDLREHYTQHWPKDWFFSLWTDASQEDLIWYWNRVVTVSFDQSAGLIEVKTNAFDPRVAQAITEAILEESQNRINELNLAAREEAMAYAMSDVEDSVEKLKEAREALTNYRIASQIVDPELDIQTRMGVMSSLQQELALALVEYDLLRGTTSNNDPRLRDTAQRIEVIRDRIAIERQNIASSSTETGGVEEDYPTLISEFERMSVDRQYAEEFYFASLTALEIARDEANRKSRYLATYIKPTLAQTSSYPDEPIMGLLTLLFLILAWSIGTLIFYSIRDKS